MTYFVSQRTSGSVCIVAVGTSTTASYSANSGLIGGCDAAPSVNKSSNPDYGSILTQSPLTTLANRGLSAVSFEAIGGAV